MKSRPRKPVSSPPSEERAAPQSLLERTRQWLLSGLVAVCVARPLVPSEGVSWLGDGHSFTMILLLLTVGYLLIALSQCRLTRRWHAVDLAVGLLVLFCVGSAVLGVMASLGAANNPEFNARHSSPRLALNAAWEWVGLGLVYFLTRQLVATRLETRGLLAIMIGLTAALAVLGLYQVTVTLPAERAAYAANPDEVLKSMGQWFAPGSPERMRFEARLAGNEPLATFALTNSLAGVLATWLIVALGVGWNYWCGRTTAVNGVAAVRYGLYLVALLLIAVCLALTNSRSAFVALAVGVLLLPLAIAPQKYRRVARWIAAVGCVAIVLAVGALIAGRADSPLAAAASKSLGYRLEYWQSTLDMIANYPVLGVGPGEFQNYYTQYKLPGASEEIRDPHNFILEVWATGGTLSFLALVAVLTGLAMATYEVSRTSEAEVPAEPRSPDSVRLMLLGAVVGLPLAYAVGVPFDFFLQPEQMILTAVSGAVVIAALWPWIDRGTLANFLPALGVVVLLVHLLASGGMTYPGVAGSLWMLAALAVNQASPLTTLDATRAAVSLADMRRLLPAAALGLVIIAVISCYLTAFLPVLSSRAALARAANTELSDDNRLEAMNAAIAADPYAVAPWLARAQLSAQRLSEDPDNPRWQKSFVDATNAVISLDGHSTSSVREILYLLGQVYTAAPSKDVSRLMLQFSRVAVRLYPNSATIQAEYALALDLAGETKRSKRAAEKALELDRLTPHADKKLPAEMRDRLDKLLKREPAAETTPEPPAGVK
jgi:hypothetical protein